MSGGIRESRVSSAQPAEARQLLSLEQAAKVLGATSRAIVYGFVVRRELRAVVLPSAGGKRRGRILIDPADLAAFIESRKTQVA